MHSACNLTTLGTEAEGIIISPPAGPRLPKSDHRHGSAELVQDWSGALLWVGGLQHSNPNSSRHSKPPWLRRNMQGATWMYEDWFHWPLQSIQAAQPLFVNSATLPPRLPWTPAFRSGTTACDVGFTYSWTPPPGCLGAPILARCTTSRPQRGPRVQRFRILCPGPALRSLLKLQCDEFTTE